MSLLMKPTNTSCPMRGMNCWPMPAAALLCMTRIQQLWSLLARWAAKGLFANGTSRARGPGGRCGSHRRRWRWCCHLALPQWRFVGPRPWHEGGAQAGVVHQHGAPRHVAANGLELVGKAALGGLGLQRVGDRIVALKTPLSLWFPAGLAMGPTPKVLAMVSLRSLGRLLIPMARTAVTKNSLSSSCGLMLSSVDWLKPNQVPARRVCVRCLRPSTASGALRGLLHGGGCKLGLRGMAVQAIGHGS